MALAAFNNLAFQDARTIFQNLSQNPFAGAPSPEIDTAWDDLLAPTHMRVSIEELQRDNQESVQLPEGGGYLAWMGVFHELHCVVRKRHKTSSLREVEQVRADCVTQRMLREWNYRSYYHADVSADEQNHLASHIGICIPFHSRSRGVHFPMRLDTSNIFDRPLL